MDTGHFFFAQPDPPAYTPDPTQPIVPAHGSTQPIHLTAEHIKTSVFNSVIAQFVLYRFFIISSLKILHTFNVSGILTMTNNKRNIFNVVGLVLVK